MKRPASSSDEKATDPRDEALVGGMRMCVKRWGLGNRPSGSCETARGPEAPDGLIVARDAGSLEESGEGATEKRGPAVWWAGDEVVGPENEGCWSPSAGVWAEYLPPEPEVLPPPGARASARCCIDVLSADLKEVSNRLPEDDEPPFGGAIDRLLVDAEMERESDDSIDELEGIILKRFSGSACKNLVLRQLCNAMSNFLVLF